MKAVRWVKKGLPGTAKYRKWLQFWSDELSLWLDVEEYEAHEVDSTTPPDVR